MLKNCSTLSFSKQQPVVKPLPFTSHNSIISKFTLHNPSPTNPLLMKGDLLIFVPLVSSGMLLISDSGFTPLELPSSRRSSSRTCIRRWIISGLIIPSRSRNFMESLTTVRKKSAVFFGIILAPSICECKHMSLQLWHFGFIVYNIITDHTKTFYGVEWLQHMLDSWYQTSNTKG